MKESVCPGHRQSVSTLHSAEKGTERRFSITADQCPPFVKISKWMKNNRTILCFIFPSKRFSCDLLLADMLKWLKVFLAHFFLVMFHERASFVFTLVKEPAKSFTLRRVTYTHLHQEKARYKSCSEVVSVRHYISNHAILSSNNPNERNIYLKYIL